MLTDPKAENAIDFEKIILIAFSILLLYSAGTISAFEVASAKLAESLAIKQDGAALSTWNHWGFRLSLFAGLELMRACFVLSNIFIRSHSPDWAQKFLYAAIAITLGIGVKIFFQTGGDISNPEFWTLEVYNALILVSEISISVNIAGTPIDWARLLSGLKGEVDFDFHGLPEWAYSPLKRIEGYVNELKNKVVDYEENEKELIAVKAVLSRVAGSESPSDLEIAEINRKATLGGLAADLWVYADDKIGYLVFCGGKEGLPTCPPFQVSRAKRSDRCPNCGKLHSRDESRARLTELA